MDPKIKIGDIEIFSLIDFILLCTAICQNFIQFSSFAVNKSEETWLRIV